MAVEMLTTPRHASLPLQSGRATNGETAEHARLLAQYPSTSAMGPKMKMPNEILAESKAVRRERSSRSNGGQAKASRPPDTWNKSQSWFEYLSDSSLFRPIVAHGLADLSNAYFFYDHAMPHSAWTIRFASDH